MHDKAIQPFFWTVRVYYEDTDAGGVVYYANYLRYFERARTEWLRAVGFEHRQTAADHGLLFVVVGLQCEYRRPARLDDTLRLKLARAKLGRASLTLSQSACRGDELLVSAQVRIACVDARHFAPRPLPKAMVEAARQLPPATATTATAEQEPNDADD